MRKYSILLVDDDPFILNGVGKDLQSEGYQVTTAESGEKAIELLRRSSFDLVISDLNMGPIDGIGVLKKVKELAPETRVIILTGFGDITSSVDALGLNADDYLIKPCEPEELFFRVKRCLEKLDSQRILKATEETLRVTQECFRATFEQAAVGLCHVNCQGRFIRVNQRLCEILGYTGDELTERTFHSITHPEDLKPDIEKKGQLVAGEIEAYRLEKRYIRKDRSVMWGNLTASLVRTSSGEPEYFLCVIEDITARKQAQEELRKYEHIVSASQEWLSFIDRNYNYQTVNDYYLKSINKKRHEIIGHSVAEIFGEKAFKTQIKNHLDQCFQGENVNYQTWIELPGQPSRFMDVMYYPFFEEDGSVSGVSVDSRDITETKQMEARLRQSQKMEAIAALAGGIAHQFNNALTGITGHIELLQMRLPDNEIANKYAKAMQVSAERMADLTNQLLAYARGGKYQSQVISLNALVKTTLPLIKHTIDPAIRIAANLGADIPKIEADVIQMQMVLSAIINNASEAIEGSGRIDVHTREQEIDEEYAGHYPGLGPGRYALLTVEDDGRGMSREAANRIFEPFFTSKLAGRGLGMAAVYDIVKNHNGWIGVDSDLGQGTAVRIYLPPVDRTGCAD